MLLTTLAKKEGRIRKHPKCTPCITQHDYTDCHKQIAKTVLQKKSLKCRISKTEPIQ